MEAFTEHQRGALHNLLLTTETFTDFLTELAHEADAATGHRCGVTTRGESGPYTVASSDPVVDQLDEFQYRDGDGPCLEALRGNAPVYVHDMQTESRWAPYPAQATLLGVRSVLSYPVEGHDRAIGALNIYSFDSYGVDETLETQAARFAAKMSGPLELGLRMSGQIGLIDHLQAAIQSHTVIDRAIGIIMGQRRCDARTAFGLLRTASQQRNIKIRAIAEQIVDGVVGAAGPQL